MRALSTSTLLLAATSLAGAEDVDFRRDVRPVLARSCFPCHGPDRGTRKADLRLDTREGALAVLVPGDAAGSELVPRITAADPAARMPPAAPLPPAQQSHALSGLSLDGEAGRCPSTPRPGSLSRRSSLFGERSILPYKRVYCALIVVATAGILENDADLDALTGLGTGVMLWANIPLMLIFGSIAMKAYKAYGKRLKDGEFDSKEG